MPFDGNSERSAPVRSLDAPPDEAHIIDEALKILGPNGERWIQGREADTWVGRTTDRCRTFLTKSGNSAGSGGRNQRNDAFEIPQIGSVGLAQHGPRLRAHSV